MPKQPLLKKQSKETSAKKSRAGVGGPQTVEGKNRARFNALKHGLKAGQLVLLLADESEEQFEAVRAGWRAKFEPEGFAENALVDELVRTHWLFLRAQRRLMEAERAIAGDDNEHPVDWTEEDEHKIELLQQYKTSHKRSYYRVLNAVQQFRKNEWQEFLLERKMRQELKKLDARERELEEQVRQLKKERGIEEEPEAEPEELEPDDYAPGSLTPAEGDAQEADGDGDAERDCRVEPTGTEDCSRMSVARVERIFRVQGAGRPVRVEQRRERCTRKLIMSPRNDF